MPPPTVVCIICNESVFKRSTLSLKEFGGGEGRACRNHEAVGKLQAVLEMQKKKHKESQKAWQTANDNIKIFMGTSAVRTLCTFQGLSLETALYRLKLAGYSDHVINEIRKEVEKKDDVCFSNEEIIEIAATLVVMREKGIV